MQRLKTKVLEKFQIKNKVQNVRALHKSPLFQCIVAAFASVGFLSWLHIRPLGLLFLTIFCFWLYKNHCNLRIRTTPELRRHMQTAQRNMAAFREAKPALFCLMGSFTLSVVAVLGFFISGTLLLYCSAALLGIISIRLNSKWFAIEPEEDCLLELDEPEYELDEEFMPEENEDNMNVLERASDLASLTLPTEDTENDEDKSDEVPSELLIPDSIPEIDENSTDDDQDELMPIVPVSTSDLLLNSSNPAKDATLKMSQSHDAIEFNKRYFKSDSSLSTTSSSSEESLSRGLQFPDHTAVDGSARSASTKAAARPATSSKQKVNDLVDMVVTSQTQTLLASGNMAIPTLMTDFVQGLLGIGAGAGAGASASASSSASTSTSASVLPNQSSILEEPTSKLINLDSSDESDFEIIERTDLQ